MDNWDGTHDSKEAKSQLKHRVSSQGRKFKIKRMMKKYYKKMKKWSDHCPAIFLCHTLMMEAEYARLNGKPILAENKYETAIGKAHDNGWTEYEALYNKLTALFYLEKGNQEIASYFMEKARKVYQKWKAFGVVQHLEKTWSELLDTQKETNVLFLPSDESHTLTETTISASHESIDLTTIMKATQTITKEVNFDQLLQSMMEVIMENTAAGRGVFLMKEELDGNFYIHYDSVLDGDPGSNKQNAEERELQILNQQSPLPIGLIEFTEYSEKPMILKDACQHEDYQSDDYIQEHQIKSILSFPIVKQGRLMGIIYLENRLTVGAFTAARLEVLQILATQAAISLDNANLYSSLENKVEERTEELRQALDISEKKQEIVRTINQETNFNIVIHKIMETITHLIPSVERSFCMVLDDTIKMKGIYYSSSMEIDHFKTINIHPKWREYFMEGVDQFNGWAYISQKDEIKKWGLYQENYLPETILSVPVIIDEQFVAFFHFDNSVDPNAFTAETMKQLTGLVDYINTAFIRSQNLKALELNEENLTKTVERKTRDLNGALDNLTKLDQLKDEFLANTSHELRTPLNGIIGIAESLKDGATGKLAQATEKNLEMIIQSGKRLANLINDILDFSKMKHQDLNLRLKPVGIQPMVELALNLSKPLTGDKPVEIKSALEENLPLVQADEDRLQQILLNLLGNAIKFTHEGEVLVSAKHEKKMIRVSIKDTGIGIPEDQLGHIFESFEQADGTTEREYGGTGLGLSVSRQLVELHNGKLDVQSKEGAGSTFSFTLPISEIQERRENQEDRRENQEGEALETDERRKTVERRDLEDQPVSRVIGKETESHFLDDEMQFEGKNQTLLIVDDEMVNLQVLQNFLSLKNYNVVIASNGRRALQSVEASKPDLMVLDLMMPRMSGYEVARKVRETYDSSSLPIIMLTAKNQVDDLVEGFQNGINDFLTKPFHKDELYSRIKTHLNLSQTTTA